MRSVVSLHDLVKSKEAALKKTEKKEVKLDMEDSDDDLYFFFDWLVCWLVRRVGGRCDGVWVDGNDG